MMWFGDDCFETDIQPPPHLAGTTSAHDSVVTKFELNYRIREDILAKSGEILTKEFMPHKKAFWKGKM
jgi:hypothetical protein